MQKSRAILIKIFIACMRKYFSKKNSRAFFEIFNSVEGIFYFIILCYLSQIRLFVAENFMTQILAQIQSIINEA